MFSTPTQVNFSLDERNHRTILELVAADRPGLLSEVGKVFKTERVAINGAKIMTVGERAEDVFYITETDGSQLQEESFERVKKSLILALDRRDANPRSYS
jgi:[protein-PII] uridylyltransferase